MPDTKLNEDDMAEIEALGMVIVAKVLDELAPNADQLTTSKIALGSLACTYAAKHLEFNATKR